jgi:hypothetical protein
MAKDGGLIGYDLTISVEKSTTDHNIVGAVLNEWFKKFAFQKEKGEKGFIHWQVRGHLIKKKTVGAMNKITQEHFWKCKLLPTCTKVHGGNKFNYVMKADSRLEGPWTEADFEDPPTLTRRVKHFMESEKYPFQAQIIKMCSEIDDRSIKVIYDPIGGNGKSTLAAYLMYTKKAYRIPAGIKSIEDIMQACHSIKPQAAYIMDMPRAMGKDKLYDLYAGLECLKDGVTYDKRYKFTQRDMDSPQIIVCTNVVPQLHMLSKDRWEIWELTRSKTLIKYEAPVVTQPVKPVKKLKKVFENTFEDYMREFFKGKRSKQ